MSSNQAAERLISRDDLKRAADQDLLTPEQGDALWRFFAESHEAAAPPTPRFDVAHLLYYTGALIIIGAMGLFTTLAFANWGGVALTTTALIYALAFTSLGHHLWRRGLTVPGGLCLTIAVTMAPLFVFGIQEELGWWHQGDPGDYQDFYHWIRGGWLPMELAAILAAIIALRFHRFPFLVAPIAVALWFMSMDLVPWIFGADWSDWDQRRIVSLWFGLAMLLIAWLVDIRADGDYAFWLHLFGLIAFWGGLTLMESDSELSKALYCLINISLLAFGVFLQRRAYAVFGAFGVAFYLQHLADHVFKDSLLYPFALSFIGLLILGAGLFYHKQQAGIADALQRLLPPPLQALRPRHAR